MFGMFYQSICNPQVLGFTTSSLLCRVISVGGDGMFHEVLNGVIIRTQKEQAVAARATDFEPLPPKIKVGIIPAGLYGLCLWRTRMNKSLAFHPLIPINPLPLPDHCACSLTHYP